MNTDVMQSSGGLLSTILHWLVSGASVLLTAYFVPGFEVSSFGSALVAALLIGLVNALLRPIFILLTLPINILTLGLLTFVINGLMLKIAAGLAPGFQVNSWGAAILGAIVLSVISAILHALLR